MATRSHYQIAIHHPGLNKHRIIRGTDRYLVEAAAVTQQRAWAEQYAKKVAVNARRQEREDKRQELEDKVRAYTRAVGISDHAYVPSAL